MSTAKQTKELLDQVRRLLDKDARTAIEPILRNILEVAKPKTVTQVTYRHDPADEAQLDSLRKALVSKDEEILKLRIKLRSAQADSESWRESFSRNERGRAADMAKIDRQLAALSSKEEEIEKLHAQLAKLSPLLDHKTFHELVQEGDKRGRAWADCMMISMKLIKRDQTYRSHRKTVLDRCLRLSLFGLLNYLTLIEGCGRIDPGKLRKIVDDNCTESLRKIAQDIYAATGITVDLALDPLEETPATHAGPYGEQRGGPADEPRVIFVGANPLPPPPFNGQKDRNAQAHRDRPHP